MPLTLGPGPEFRAKPINYAIVFTQFMNEATDAMQAIGNWK